MHTEKVWITSEIYIKVLLSLTKVEFELKLFNFSLKLFQLNSRYKEVFSLEDVAVYSLAISFSQNGKVSAIFFGSISFCF